MWMNGFPEGEITCGSYAAWLPRGFRLTCETREEGRRGASSSAV